MSCCGGSGQPGCCDKEICDEVAAAYRSYLSKLVVEKWEKDLAKLEDDVRRFSQDERSESSEDASIDRKDIPS